MLGGSSAMKLIALWTPCKFCISLLPRAYHHFSHQKIQPTHRVILLFVILRYPSFYSFSSDCPFHFLWTIPILSRSVCTFTWYHILVYTWAIFYPDIHVRTINLVSGFRICCPVFVRWPNVISRLGYGVCISRQLKKCWYRLWINIFSLVII